MNERLTQIAGQMRDVWNGMPVQRRFILGGAVGAVFLILTLLSLTLNSGARNDVLFSRLAATDASEVLQQLDELGMTYEIRQGSDGTSTILVPEERVYRTRIDLAAQGIPRQGSVGFEIFDETKLGMTDDVRRVNLRRALNGELERTIRALDVIEDARVQVALPQNKLFISQQENPTAAVMVTLRPGLRLAADQVRAIQRLVGATVEGLNPGDVFIVDNRGNPVSDQLAQLGGENGVNSVEKQLLIQQAVSNEYTRQVRTMLEGPYGVGRVEALVKVELNFQNAEEIVKAFEAPDRGQGIIRSEQRTEELFEGTGTPPGGVPGVESNVPGYVGLVATGDSEYTRTDETINYEINQTETRRVIPPGAVKRMSVAVLIDGNLSDEQEAGIAGTLTTALGLNDARGDRVNVDSLPFASSQALADAQVQAGETVWGLPPQYALAAAAFLAIMALIYWRMRRRRVGEQQGIDVVVGEDEEEEILRERTVTPEERRRRQLRDQIVAMAQENPQDVAQLLKSWLTEE